MGTQSLYGPTYVPSVTPTHDKVTLNGRPLYTSVEYAQRVKGTGIVCYILLATIVFSLWHKKEDQMYINALLLGSVAGCVNFAVSVITQRIVLTTGTDLFSKISVVPTVIFLFTLMICLHGMMFILITGLEKKFYKWMQNYRLL